MLNVNVSKKDALVASGVTIVMWAVIPQVIKLFKYAWRKVPSTNDKD